MSQGMKNPALAKIHQVRVALAQGNAAVPNRPAGPLISTAFWRVVQNVILPIMRHVALLASGVTKQISVRLPAAAHVRAGAGRLFHLLRTQILRRPKLIRSARSNLDWPRFEQAMLWGCAGLTVVCGILVIVLMAQSRRFEKESAEFRRALALAEMKISKLETRPQVDSSVAAISRGMETTPPGTSKMPAAIAKTNALQPISLSENDIATIHQFIKTVPSKSAVSTVQVGDPVGQMATAPIPQLLVESVPKLAGAKFSIDDAGSILIIAINSDTISAVVSPR